MAKITKQHREAAEKFYTENYVGRLTLNGKKVGPKTVEAIKEAMAHAKATGGKMAVAVKTYCGAKKIDIAAKAGAAPAAAKASADKPVEAPPAKAKAAEVIRTTESATNEVKRRLEVLQHFKAAGVDVPAKPSTTLEGLRQEMEKARIEFRDANPKAKKEFDRLNIGAMEENRVECIGVLPEFESISCDGCSFKAECTRQFILNTKSGFSKYDQWKVGLAAGDVKAEVDLVTGTTEPAAQPATKSNGVAKKSAEAAKPAPVKKAKKGALDDGWTLQVNSFDTPDEAGEAYAKPAKNADEGEHTQYRMLVQILKDVPETVGALREIVGQHYEDVSEADFGALVKALENDAFIMVERA